MCANIDAGTLPSLAGKNTKKASKTPLAPPTSKRTPTPTTGDHAGTNLDGHVPSPGRAPLQGKPRPSNACRVRVLQAAAGPAGGQVGRRRAKERCLVPRRPHSDSVRGERPFQLHFRKVKLRLTASHSQQLSLYPSSVGARGAHLVEQPNEVYVFFGNIRHDAVTVERGQPSPGDINAVNLLHHKRNQLPLHQVLLT